MAILVTCTSCQAKLKAPDKGAGRRIKCLQCGASLLVPTAPAPTAKPAPPARRLPPATLPGSVHQDPGRSWLHVALASGACLVLILAVVLAAKLIINARATRHEEAVAAPAPKENSKPADEQAKADEPEITPRPGPSRADRLAEVEAREKAELAPLLKKVEKHKQTLAQFKKEEDELFKKAKFVPPKIGAAQAKYQKELTAALPAIVRDMIALDRKQDDLTQERRRIMFEDPRPGDPKLEDYVGLYLTPDEIRDLGKVGLSSGSARAVAQRHIQAAELAETIARPTFSAAYLDPLEKDVAVLAYKVAAYRGRAGKDLPVHIYVWRRKGVWTVFEWPGRNFSVLIGEAPEGWQKMD